MKKAIELAKILNENSLHGYGAEIGVAHGNFSKELLSLWKGHLYLVDCWTFTPFYRFQNQEENYQAMLANIEPYKSRTTIVRKMSKDAALEIEDESLDFVFIDADHSCPAVKEDLSVWWPKLKKGGLFSGHDYWDGVRGHQKYGVKSAVDDFCSKLNMSINIIDDTSPTWWFLKKTAIITI